MLLVGELTVEEALGYLEVDGDEDPVTVADGITETRP